MVIDAADVEPFAACEESCIVRQHQTKQPGRGIDYIPLPLTVTVGSEPELAFEALASILAGVASALTPTAEAAAAAIAKAPFIVVSRMEVRLYVLFHTIDADM